MSQVFFVSDLHLGHKNICKYRKEFTSQKEHDSTIVNNILKCAGKRNHLWMLGDCFFTKESLTHLYLFKQSFDKVHWILGNHDTDRPESKENVFLAANRGWVDGIYSMAKINRFWLSHAPIHTDELRGRMNIHGHTHYHNIDDDRYINVSMEQIDYKPISLQNILTKLQKQK